MPRRLMGKQGREMASKKRETSATSTKQSPFKSRIDGEKSFKDSPKKTTSENANDSDGSIKEDEEFVVERIVAARKTRSGRMEYNVKWFGYDDAQNTWEPRSNLHHCDDLLRQFEAEQAAKIGEKAGLTTRQMKQPSSSQQKRTKTVDASNDLEEQASSFNRKKQRLDVPQKKKEKASFGSGNEGSDKSGQIPTPRSQLKKERRRLFTHEDFADVPTIDIKEEEMTPPPPSLESASKGKKTATRKTAPRGSTKPKKDEAKEDKDDENEGRQSRSDTKPKSKKVKNVRDQEDDEERERAGSDHSEPISNKRVDRASAKSSNLKNQIKNEVHDGSSKQSRRPAVPKAKLDEDDSDEDDHRDRSRKTTTIRKPVATKKKEDQAPRKRKMPTYEEDEDQNEDDDQVVPTKVLCATRQQISKKKFLVQYAVELAKTGAKGRNDNQPSYAIWRSSRLFAANPRLIVDWWETSAYWPKCEQDANELLSENAHSDVHHVAGGSLNDVGVGDEHANDSDGTSSFEPGKDESGNEDSQSGNGDRLAIDDQAVQALESGGDSGESNENENREEEIEGDPPSDGDEFENGAGTSAGTDGGEMSATSMSIN